MNVQVSGDPGGGSPGRTSGGTIATAVASVVCPLAVPRRRPEVDRRTTALHADVLQTVDRVCPGWLADHRDDLVQCAMMYVLGIMRRSPADRRLTSGYLFRVAQNALRDEIRRRRWRSEVALDDAVLVCEPAAATFGPDRLASSAEIGRAIADCLRQLAEPRRVAVILNLQGHSVPEAARLLGWTVKKTENLVYRGLADLRRSLAARGVAP
jgi:RNA polymerase sigma-70 factor (ECF subfamily)